MIPLVDLKANYRAIEKEVQDAIHRVLDSASFILGSEVTEFEREYAAFLGAKHCIGVANGTDALELAIRAAGLGRGDGVLLPANTFIATALAVARAGATPLLVDCDEDSLIDVAACERRLSREVKAVLPVHLFGQCAPMADVLAFARAHRLTVIEDSAQAQGARWNGTCAGTQGLVSGTSFYPGKNLGAYGDAGAVTTNDDDVAKRVRALRNYGSEVKYFYPEVGFNSRLDTMQAAVLRIKLRRLAEWNAQRRAAAERYLGLLKPGADLTLPRVVPGNEHIWHLFVVRVPAARRDAIVTRLQSAGIGVGIHYPVPIHLQGAFQSLGHRVGDFPVAERLAAEMISLPLYPEITAAQQEQVAVALRRALPEA